MAFPRNLLLFLEAAVHRCSSKQVLLEISQYSQEMICVGVSFLIKLQCLQCATLFQPRPMRLQHKCFPENIVKSLRNSFFCRTPTVAAVARLIK